MSVTVKDLEIFEADCKLRFETIKASLNEFNIFNVLGVQRREIRHSNFLGWLFDPNETHNLGPVFLEELLKLTAEIESISTERIKMILDADLSNTIVRRETENNIDILIINRELDFIICIENKIDADYSSHQLAKYYRYVEKFYGSISNRIYLTLTPLSSHSHINYEEGENYKNITYMDICEFISSQQFRVNTAKANIRESIIQYKKMVEKDITGNNEEVRIAQELYKKYKAEIDFIVSHKLNFLSFKKEVEACVNKGDLEGYDFSHESHSNVIFILPTNEPLRELFKYPEAKSRKGDFIFSLVLFFESNSVWMKFGFGDIVESEKKASIQKVKSRFYNTMKDFEVFKTNYSPEFAFDMHPGSGEDTFPGICGVRLLDEDNLADSELDFLELFIQRFKLLDELVIQSWIKECLDKLSSIEFDEV